MIQDNRLHIVVFTDTFFETNGVGTYYRTLLKWVRQAGGVHLTVVCPKRRDLDCGAPSDDVVAVKPMFNFKNPFYRDLTVGYYRQGPLRSLVRSLPGRLVVHIATSGPLGMAAAQMARSLKLPAIGCYHTDLSHYASLYGKVALGSPGAWLAAQTATLCDKIAYGRCDAIYAPTETAEASVQSFYQGPTCVLPHPIDTDTFKPSKTRAGHFREAHCSKDEVLAITVGRIAREKNLDRVCELLNEDGRIKHVLVGDGPYASKLRRRYGARVTGFLKGPALVEAYQQSDVFVQLSRTETFGLSLAESLSCGLPAVVLRSQGFTEKLPPDSGVEVLNENEVPALAERCVALVSDRNRHGECSRRVRKLVQPLGVDAMIPRFIEFHRDHAG